MVERVRLHKDMPNGQKHFVTGHKKKQGRKPGQPNKNTRILKEAILLAAELQGRDGKGQDGLVGYLRKIADREPKAFCMLLARILPMQFSGTVRSTFNLIKAGVSEKDAVALWLDTMQSMKGQLLQEGMSPPMMIEHDEHEIVA